MKRRDCLASCLAWAGLARGQALHAPPVAIAAIGFDEGSLPTMYRAGTSPAARGIYPALVVAAFAAMHRPCELRALPFKRMLTEVDAGQLIAGAVIRTPEREQRLLFSQPYFLERLAVYSTGASYQGLDSLQGKRVGVIRGWSYGEAFDTARRQGRFVCEDVASDVHNFAKLLRGRIDYAVVTELGGRMLQQLAAYEGRVMAGNAALGATAIHLALPRTQDGGAALLAAFNAAVELLHRDGLVEPLVAREIAAAAEVARTLPAG